MQRRFEDGRARFHGFVVAEENAPDGVAADVQHLALHTVAEQDNLAQFRARKPANECDIVADAEHAADVLDPRRVLEVTSEFTKARERLRQLLFPGHRSPRSALSRSSLTVRRRLRSTTTSPDRNRQPAINSGMNFVRHRGWGGANRAWTSKGASFRRTCCSPVGSRGTSTVTEAVASIPWRNATRPSSVTSSGQRSARCRSQASSSDWPAVFSKSDPASPTAVSSTLSWN